MANSPDTPPNFSGTWKADLQKSAFRGTAPLELIHHIEHREAAVEHELVITRERGGEERAKFRYLTNGAPTVNRLAVQEVTTRAWWDGVELAIESWSEAPRRFRVIDRWSLSSDGRTLTMAHREGDLAGQVVVNHRER